MTKNKKPIRLATPHRQYSGLLRVCAALTVLLVGLVGAWLLHGSRAVGSATLSRNTTSDAALFASTTGELGRRGFLKTSLANVGTDLSKTMATSCSLPTWPNVTADKLTVSKTICWPSSEIDPNLSQYWKVQGMGGNNTAGDLGGLPHANYLLVALYNKPAEDTAKIQLVDTGVSPAKYQDIYLMGSCSTTSCPLNLNTHAGGVAMVGRWIYVADTSGILVFDSQAVYQNPSTGLYYLPRYGRWSLAQSTITCNDGTQVKTPKISSLAIDPSTYKIVTVEYVDKALSCDSTNVTDIIWWDASEGGLDAASSTNANGDTVKSATATNVYSFSASADPRHINGGISFKGKTYLNDTSETVDGSSDQQVQYKHNASMGLEKTILMPKTNPEGIYLNTCSNMFWTANEGTSVMANTFIYGYSLESISPEAGTATACGTVVKPTASITSPLAGALITQGSSVAIAAAAEDTATAVTKVEFLIDGVIATADTTEPYTYTWATANASIGTHTLTAKAYNKYNLATTSTAISVSVQASAVLGDLNGDNQVNVFDLSSLLASWSRTAGMADLNQDGIVNVFDLSVLLRNWTP